ncbi:MAG TPA: tRNA (N6-isopentenyl adenosine(37)-C2)-methylthiotransferase MiaB [Bacteroidota bacterium]|nr:tRNA (N6-isopentenyl adenosine(37)-C2)-methylthiotransferase MiaB [Bacteroidota bacterium]
MEKANNKKVYIETYGCQMNLADSEIISGLMSTRGYNITSEIEGADIILLNTCSVREHAEERVIQRIKTLSKLKSKKPFILGVIGCMAERLKEELFEIDYEIDLVLGPDNYRKLPEYINNIEEQKKICDTQLSEIETYSDIIPSRDSTVTAWLPIMRGCDNYCSYCIVPFTRGKERSRSFSSIIDEAKYLIDKNYKEIYLLGQNVNSYFDSDKDFSDLLSSVANLNENIRIRFMTSHPKDLSDKLIFTIKEHPNICKYIHLPFQSGSDRILKLMNRNYTKKDYLNLIDRIKNNIPGVSLSTDIIVGFPTETEQDFLDTLDIVNKVKFDSAFTFKYSPREGTIAYNFDDDISDEIKGDRLKRLIDIQQQISFESNNKLIGTIQTALIESYSKKSEKEFQGRLDNNKVTVFPGNGNFIGDLVNVKITKATSATLIGELL